MNKAELFKKIFGIYAEEFWAFPEEKMLDWIASDAPDIYVGKWTQVAEKPPKEKQDVLLAFSHNMAVGFWEDILKDGSQTWYANSGNGWFAGTEAPDDDGVPIAWMELPKPYEYPPKDFMNPPERSDE